MNWLFGDGCLLEEYLADLSDEILADLYAIRMGYFVKPGDPYRYQKYIDGLTYCLVEIPPRQEIIAEIIRQENGA